MADEFAKIRRKLIDDCWGNIARTEEKGPLERLLEPDYILVMQGEPLSQEDIEVLRVIWWGQLEFYHGAAAQLLGAAEALRVRLKALDSRVDGGCQPAVAVIRAEPMPFNCPVKLRPGYGYENAEVLGKVKHLSPMQYEAIRHLIEVFPDGLTAKELDDKVGGTDVRKCLSDLLREDDWRAILRQPSDCIGRESFRERRVWKIAEKQ